MPNRHYHAHFTDEEMQLVILNDKKQNKTKQNKQTMVIFHSTGRKTPFCELAIIWKVQIGKAIELEHKF